MNSSRKYFIERTAAFGVAALGVTQSASQSAAGQDTRTIKLVIVISDDVTPVIYANQTGIFKRAGLNVELQVVNSGAAAAAAVVGGAAQIGISTLMNLIEAREHGVPFTLVAPGSVITTDDGYSQFIVLKDSPIKTARDLNGKTVSVPALKNLEAIAIMNWMEKNGGDPKTLRFVEIPVFAAAEAVENGRIDGANLNTPSLTRALDRGKVRVLAQIFDAIAPRFTNTDWFTTSDFAASNREVIERFARSIREASMYCNSHHAETAPILATFMNLDPRLVARMARCTFSEDLSVREIQPLIELAYKYNLIEKPFDPKQLISPYAARVLR